MKPKIDPSKKYTSGGHPVEFLHRAPEGWKLPHPWRGIVSASERTWTDDGWCYAGTASSQDLIEVREPLEVNLVVDRNSIVHGVTNLTLESWNNLRPTQAPHRLVKFREVIE